MGPYKLLSIIVPVYNVEKYIGACLDSVAAAGDRLDRVEALIVNDATPDRSAELAKEYIRRFPESFRFIDKAENGGHGSAWNEGLGQAEGKFILFLDSDDALENLGRLLSFLEKTEADLIVCDKTEFTDGTGEIRKVKMSLPPAGVAVNLEEEDWKYDCRFCHFHTCVYRKSILTPFQPLFHERTSYDDTILFAAPLIKAGKVVYTGFPLYRYRVGRDGQSMDILQIKKKIGQLIGEGRYLLDFVNSHPADSEGKRNLLKRISKRTVKTRCDYILHLPSSGERSSLLESWTDYVTQALPYWKEIPEVRWFKRYPYPVFRLLLKCKNLCNRLFK